MKSKLKKEAKEKHFRVAVFGSARIKKNGLEYKLIYKLAKMVAAENIDIVTGGGQGLMAAASSGHHAGRKNRKVHSIGLNIKLPMEQKFNGHLDIKKEFSRFSERLDNFMQLSNAVVVAPGGVGTMLEFFYTWQLVQVKHICDIPVILLGEMWLDLLKWIRKWPLENGLIDKKDFNLLFFAKNPEDAMKIIKLTHEEYKKGGKNICLNIKKYKIT
ncbi:LOG family protein [Candidatus Woesearchaeota archaeon]|nr:LOG family protein [Candidatus Woesearchaeota archaeon]